MPKPTPRTPKAPAQKPVVVVLIDQIASGFTGSAVHDRMIKELRRTVVDLLLTGEALVREAELAAQRDGNNRDPSHNTAVRAGIAAQHAARFGDQ
jgi:putative NIF3 family GTP cyclohydrolase 1 type 2